MDATGQTRGDRAPAIVVASPSDKSKGLASDLVAVWVLAMVSLLLGGLANAFRDEPLPWMYTSREQTLTAIVDHLQETSASPATASATSDPTHEIRLEEFQPFMAEHRGPVLDARPVVFYREAHVPGAWSLPRETFAGDYSRLRGQLEGFKDKPIALYCSGPDCPDSQLVADALTRLGYRHLVIYTAGWEEWSHTGLPQEGAAVTP